jgi:hypothetical protein
MHRPRGRVEVLRSGQPGMDAGLAAPGHGWPMAAGPRSRTGARACRALARHRTKGAKAFGYFALFKVTRRKGGTNSSHYRRNGYTPNLNRSRQTPQSGAATTAHTTPHAPAVQHGCRSPQSCLSPVPPTDPSGQWSRAGER